MPNTIEIASSSMVRDLSATTNISYPWRAGLIANTYGVGTYNTAATSNAGTYESSTSAYTQPLLFRFSGMTSAGSRSGSVGKVCIMKGTPPATPDSLTGYAALANDVLVTYGATGYGILGSLSVQATNGAVLLSGDYEIASSSGEATWFWMMSRAITAFSSGSYTYTNTVYHSVIGSIGLIGSGSDMEIATTNIVSGYRYRFEPFTLSLPTTFTY